MGHTYSTTVIELKDKILSLAAERPEEFRLGVQKILRTSEGSHKFAIFCDYLGMNYSRELFEFLSVFQWNNIIEQLKLGTKESNQANFAQALLEVYQEILVECMYYEGVPTSEDPFLFLSQWNRIKLLSFLSNEDPAKLALIAIYWGQTELLELLRSLTPPMKARVVLHISRLSRIPNSSARESANHYAKDLFNRLSSIKQPPPPPPVGLSNGQVSEKIRQILTEIDLAAEEKFFRVILPKSERMKEKWNHLQRLHQKSIQTIKEAISQNAVSPLAKSRSDTF
jgi:flagellar motor switch protein FliG